MPLRRGDRAAYLRWAVDAFRLATSGVRDETQVHTHLCYSEFGDIMDSIAEMDADVLSIESSRSGMALLSDFGRCRYPNEVGPGVYDIHSPRVPSREEMEELIAKAAEVLPPGRLWVNPDCGLKTRGWPEVEASLANMVEAARRARERLGPAARLSRGVPGQTFPGSRPLPEPAGSGTIPMRGSRRTGADAGGGRSLDPKWYLVKTKALNENRVFTRLTGAGYDVLFPKFQKKSRRHKDVIDVRPLFPTYLFVLFRGDELKTIKYTHGVARVICFGLEPQEVGEEIIAAIRERMDDEGFVKLEPKKVDLSPGQKVKIGEGPFAGLDAIFLEELPDRERVVLLLDAVSSYKLTIEKQSTSKRSPSSPCPEHPKKTEECLPEVGIIGDTVAFGENRACPREGIIHGPRMGGSLRAVPGRPL